MELLPKTRCQLALVVRKRPRPKALPWNVVVIDSDPPIIETDDVEEYLVHDPLFVEFFNAFLALPSFPEPICFNVESGGFEVVTDGKLKLAQQIKEAVRSQSIKNDIYEKTHRHAYSDIPVVPIEDSKGPEQVHIERMFDVMALNKDQGLAWVKHARFPIFLESDYYFQYRLAKVISQASIFNEKGEFVIMKIDYTIKARTKKKAVEVHQPTQEELIMKEMYVSFGDLKGAAKEAWFTQAKQQLLKTDSTFTTLSPKITPMAGGDTGSALKQSKKSSVFNSHYFGAYLPGLIGPNDTEPPIHDKTKIKDRLFSRERPFTPRPSDRIHAATSMLRAKLSKDPNAQEEMVPAGHVVFLWPKQDQEMTFAESSLGDKAERDAEFSKRMREHQIIDQIYNDGSWEEGGTGNIVLKSMEELGSVIVGAVMKKTMAELMNTSEETAAQDPAISSIYPSKDLTCVSVDKLNLCMVVEAPESKENLSVVSTSYDNMQDAENFVDREPVHIRWKKPIRKPAEEDPNEESLLDSDEDFEVRDTHFRRNREKWHSLASIKGIQAFKKFLKGTQGEKYWELWIDIDKGRLIKSEEEKQTYIMQMRNKFHKKGSQFELSAENKRKLNLENLSQWTPEHLFQVQAHVLEPLVLYWAPRYLLSHLIHTNPQKYYLYNELKLSASQPPSDPYPNTQELLPLRPKSCCSRSTSGYGVWETDQDGHLKNIQDLKTTPRVGNHRVYGRDTMQRLAKTETGKYLKHVKHLQHAKSIRTPSEALTHVNMPPKFSTTSSVHSKGFSDMPSELFTEESAGQGSHRNGMSLDIPPSSIGTQSPSVPLNHHHHHHHHHKYEYAKIPCPYKPIRSTLQDSKEHREYSPNGMDRKHKLLLLPLLKAVDTKGEKCKGVKSKFLKKIESQESTGYTFFRQDSKESRKSCEEYHSALMESQMSAEEAMLMEEMECDFLNSESIQFLLQGLHHEADSGRAFRKWIHKNNRQDWLKNLDFWEKVQEYRKLFYKDKLDLHFITRQARSIFAQYIVESGSQSINVKDHIKYFVLDHLSPPYEDLFDRAEESALKILFEAFTLYIDEDVKNYCEVDRTIIKRRLETRNRHILDLQRQGIIKERSLTPDDPMEGYVDPVYDDSVLARVPAQFRTWDMPKLAQHKLELEYFRQFLIPRHAEIDLQCWMDMEAWRQTDPNDKVLREFRAKEIKKKYLTKKYFFGPNSPATKEGQNKVMEAGGGWGKFLEEKPHSNSILKAQKYVRARLEKKHLPFFLLTEDFQGRHRVDSSIYEEDVFMFHKKRSLALTNVLSEGEQRFESLVEQKDKLLEDMEFWKLFISEQDALQTKDTDMETTAAKSVTGKESRWTAAIREIFLLQRALKNPTSCAQFQKFVSLSGGFLENDIMFWLEVQKYKKMHYGPVSDETLFSKVNAIVNCFIDSYLPPALQIDIPQEMANTIKEHKHELSPNLFRQAQLTVFRGLLLHWVAFREYHKQEGTEDKILQTLARHRAVAYYKEKMYREKLAQARELERLHRLQHTKDKGSEQEEEEQARTASELEYLIQLSGQEKESYLQQLYDEAFCKATQTVRQNTAVPRSVSDLGVMENGDAQTDTVLGQLENGSRMKSSQTSTKKHSKISRVTWGQEEVSNSAHKVKLPETAPCVKQ